MFTEICFMPSLVRKMVLLPLLAVVCCLGCPKNSFAEPFKLSIDTSYRKDLISWSIAGNSAGTNPNILSELIWDDLEIFQLQFKGEKVLDAVSSYRLEPFSRVKVAYGYILQGKNRDSDYHGDNRTEEYSRTNNSSDEGHTLDLSFGGGVRYPLITERLFLILMIGYSYHEQNLAIKNGIQNIPPSGPFEGLDSSYETQWKGPWCGFEVRYQPTQKLSLNGSFEYHWATYHAIADWNLITEFAHPKSFAHDADGTGLVYELAAEFLFTKKVSLSLSGVVQNWKTDAGLDRVYYANGVISDTRLNEVEWESVAVSMGLLYRF